MSIEKKSFYVTIRGQYQSLHEGSGVPTLKPYEEIFVLPSQEAALSNICKHLLSPRLRKVHSDYIRYRTHEMVNITLKGYHPDKDVLQMSIDDMDLLQLHDFCILRQIMIDPYKHAAKDVFALRAMVQKAYNDKRTSEKEKLTSKEGAFEKEADSLRRLNDLDPTASDPVININEQKITQAAKAASSMVNPGPQQSIEADEPLPAPELDGEPVLE